MELKFSDVVFIPEGHRYLLGQLDLQGITSTLIPAIFGSYTENIPEDILQRAAERGTAIHEEIARIDEGSSFATTYEEMEYTRLRDELGLLSVQSEYIVTDGKNFASAIDKVYEGDIIADIKTTSELHIPEVTFQLSWYATYYKEQNKREVSKAYVIWLPKEQYGKCKIEEIKLASPTLIKKIVREYLKGKEVNKYAKEFGVITPTSEDNLPANIQEAVTSMAAYERQIKALDAQMKTLKEARDKFNEVAIKYFVESNEKKIEGDGFTISYIAPTIRTSIDTKALEKDLPEVYAQYKRESVVRENIRINIK